MSLKGLFIVFEGVDRTGKTTQSKLLQTALRNSELHVFPNRGSEIGKIIDKYLRREIELSDEAIHLLFSANRWELNDLLSEKLDRGINIIVDRYTYSGVAYSSAKGLDLEWCSVQDEGLLVPDIVFYLDGSTTLIEQREEFGEECYETTVFQRKVLYQYDLLKTNIWYVINAALNIDVIHNIIIEKINRM